MDLKSEIEEFIENGTENTANKLESLVSSLIKQKNEVLALKVENPGLYSDLLQKLVDAARDPEGEFDKIISSLTKLVTDDPSMFKDNIYQLVIECMMREKSTSCSMQNFEQFLKSVIKIFAKDATQFVKKLLDALNKKFNNFLIPKKRKRKNKTDCDENSKKLKLTEGSIITSSINIINVWPQSTIILFDDIITRLNVSQVLNLWEILNRELLHTLEKAKISLTENELFMIDFIAVFLCQIFNCCRIHEHLIYKKPEISSAIRDFNQVQHEFYEVIFNTEHNNRIMSAFLRISYDYENFLMLFFYHYDPEVKSELDSVFLTDQSRIKSSEWKIIQQRIRNFGKSEEKNYSNLRHVQQIIKSKIFDSEMEIEEDFISNLLSDNEQMDLIMRQKDARATVLGLLKEHQHFSLFVEYLCGHVVDDEDITVILSFLTEPESIDLFVEEILKSDDNKKVVKLLKIVPLSAISNEKKKMVFKKMLDATSDVELQDSLTSIFLKLLKSDAYKNVLVDFTLPKIVKKLSNLTKFATVFETMFKQNLKRFNVDMIQKFQWIISEGGEKLFQIFANTFTEVNFRNVNVPKENLNAFKNEVVKKLSSMIDEKNVVSQESVFLSYSKLCLQNMDIVEDEVKKHHMKLLNNFITSSGSCSSEHSTELFKMVLRDAKKLNLNDEIKYRIVNVLLKHLNEIIETNVKGVEDKSDRIDTERELITLLTSIKPGCKLECSKFMQKLVTESKEISVPQQIYCFKIFQVLFEHSEKQNNRELIKSYMNFFDTSILQRENLTDTDLLCTIFNAHNEMIKTNKEHVDNVAMDKIFMFLIDSDNRPSSESVDDFCKFYEAIGQFLYLVGNFQHHYFKARQPQYFKVYQIILEDVYFYQRDNEDIELSPKEILILQRLSLQLENILKMLMKYHASSFGVIIPYIITPIINVYMKNPKLLTLNDKFKLNIKNICLHLLGAIDDRARKHIFAVVDEPTRDVYSQLISELKMKK